MVPGWIETGFGDLINVTNIRRILVDGNKLIIQHTGGADTDYAYPDLAAAQQALAEFSAALEISPIGNPYMVSITPAAISQATLPQNITVTGVLFDATAVIVLQNYTGATTLVTVFNTANSLTATVPGAQGIGTYDVIYSDSNGKFDRVNNAFVVY